MFGKNKSETELKLELASLKKENEKLKTELKFYKDNEDSLNQLVKECEVVKRQFEEASAEANKAKAEFQELYRLILLDKK